MSLGSVFLDKPTPQESERISLCKKGGCIISAMLGLTPAQRAQLGPAEFHHIKVGNVTVGQRFGYAVSRYFHRGILPRGYTQAQAREEFGPTIMSSAAFHNRFGSDQELLDRQDDAIGWPRAVIERTRHRPERSRCLPGRKGFPRRGIA